MLLDCLPLNKEGEIKHFENELHGALNYLVPNFIEVMRSVIVNDYAMYLQFKFGATLLLFYTPHLLVSCVLYSILLFYTELTRLFFV